MSYLASGRKLDIYIYKKNEKEKVYEVQSWFVKDVRAWETRMSIYEERNSYLFSYFSHDYY